MFTMLWRSSVLGSPGKPHEMTVEHSTATDLDGAAGATPNKQMIAGAEFHMKKSKWLIVVDSS